VRGERGEFVSLLAGRDGIEAYLRCEPGNAVTPSSFCRWSSWRGLAVVVPARGQLIAHAGTRTAEPTQGRR